MWDRVRVKVGVGFFGVISLFSVELGKIFFFRVLLFCRGGIVG